MFAALFFFHRFFYKLAKHLHIDRLIELNKLSQCILSFINQPITPDFQFMKISCLSAAVS